MPAPFAALEARVNAAVIDHLANRVGSFTPVAGVARDVSGVFDAEYATQLEQMAGDSTPAFSGRTDQLADATRGSLLTLPEGNFEVVEAQPDGAGMTVLRLRSV